MALLKTLARPLAAIQTQHGRAVLIVGDDKAHRNARKPTDRPKGHAATGASELNVSETSGGEILKRGVQRIVHAAA